MALDDPYYRRPFVPADDVNQRIQGTQGMLSGFEGQSLQNQMMKQNLARGQQEMNMQNQPITPELEAVFAKVANDFGRPDIAQKYSRTQQIPNETGMDRPVGPSHMAPNSQGLASQMDTGMAVQMSQPIRQAPREQLTNRRFNQFMAAAGPVADDERTQKSQRSIAQTYADQRTATANQKNELEWAKLDAKNLMHEMDLEVKKGNLQQRIKHQAAQIELGYARIKASMSKWQGMSAKERIEVLKDMKAEMGQIRNNIAELGKDPATLLMNDKLAAYHRAQEARLEELQRLHDTLRSSILDNPTEEPRSGESSSVPAGVQPPTQSTETTALAKPNATKKSRVGEVVDIGGGRKGTITGWNARLKKWDVKPNK